MLMAIFGIKFITPKYVGRHTEIRHGWHLDPMTEKPKEFDSVQRARAYAELSFNIKPDRKLESQGYLRECREIPYTIVRIR